MPLLLTRTLRRVLTRSLAMPTSHRTLEGHERTPNRRRTRVVAYEDGEVLDDLVAFDDELAALDALVVRLMQERIDMQGDERCDLAAFTF